MNTVSTPSVFHFSMKLSSWLSAWVVSRPWMLSSPVVPSVDADGFFRPGTIVFFTIADDLVWPSTATFLPSSVFSLLQQLDENPSPRVAGCSPGVTRRPGGALSIIAWSRSNVRSTRLCCLVTHELRLTRRVVERPDHGEHVVVVGERRAGRERVGARDRDVLLVDGHDLAARDAAVLVDVVDERLVDLLLVQPDLGEVGYVLDAVEVDERDPELDRGRGHAVAERLDDRRVVPLVVGVVVSPGFAVLVPLPHALSTNAIASAPAPCGRPIRTTPSSPVTCHA